MAPPRSRGRGRRCPRLPCPCRGPPAECRCTRLPKFRGLRGPRPPRSTPQNPNPNPLALVPIPPPLPHSPHLVPIPPLFNPTPPLPTLYAYPLPSNRLHTLLPVIPIPLPRFSPDPLFAAGPAASGLTFRTRTRCSPPSRPSCLPRSDSGHPPSPAAGFCRLPHPLPLEPLAAG